MKMNHTINRQQGLTLIELMVALLISLLILAGLITVYQSNNRAMRTSDSLIRIQESGRFSMDFIIRDLRMAGFPAIDTSLHNQVAGTDGGGTASDTLNIVNNTGTDCLGDAVAGVVTNTYTVANTPRLNRQGTLIPALFCNNVELVEGIENMQVLYGIDTDAKRDGVPNRYTTANNVVAMAGGWERVVAVRIAMLATSVDAFLAGTSTRTYRMLIPGGLGAINDNIMRREYTTTVSLENYLYEYN
ncbi:MAG: PilW family protein [Gammaproteobacteria bacterium]|nr:PilW family protein [Gammaproteobacteria bacterium]